MVRWPPGFLEYVTMPFPSPALADEDRCWERLGAAMRAKDLKASLAAADAIDWYQTVRDLQTLPKGRPRRSVFRLWIGDLSEPMQVEFTAHEWRWFVHPFMEGLVCRAWNPLEDRAFYEAVEKMPGLVKVLADLCNPWELSTSQGESLIHLVAQAGIGFPPKAQWFRQALSTPTDINAQTLRGHTALHLLWSNAALDNTRREDLAEWNRCNRLLLNAGLDVSIQAQNGLTGRQVFEQALSSRSALSEFADLLRASFERSYQQGRRERLDQALPDPVSARPRLRF